MTTSGTDSDKRFVVAMSGGVDSSVAAWMLAREGLSVVGLFMRNGVHVDAAESSKKSCCSASDARDARMVAAHLGISFQAVDLKEEFGQIIRYFLSEYGRGRTPNPCAVCNRDLKFNRLLRFARELGAEGVATGHYARLSIEGGRVKVRRGADTAKDQSYQLFGVAEENLARTRLPIGDLKKAQVRELARTAGLKTAEKKDSQEICFVPGNDYRKLLEEKGVERHPGDLVDTAGRKLGEHDGTENFTIGQRRGHGIGGGDPLFVVALESESGRVVLGAREECTVRSMRVSDLNWIGFDVPASGEMRCTVQHRYHCEPAGATVFVSSGAGGRAGVGRGDAEVVFDEPQMAVTPGQGAAFYRGDLLLGGGWIDSTPRSRSAADVAPHVVSRVAVEENAS
jgi:tRNA-specific 2-thiouridylase